MFLFFKIASNLRRIVQERKPVLRHALAKFIPGMDGMDAHENMRVKRHHKTIKTANTEATPRYPRKEKSTKEGILCLKTRFCELIQVEPTNSEVTALAQFAAVDAPKTNKNLPFFPPTSRTCQNHALISRILPSSLSKGH